MKVNFDEEFMQDVLPIDGQNYQIKEINENCQAYCTKQKRVRQINSRDEKLIRNPFKDKKEDILAQILECKI